MSWNTAAQNLLAADAPLQLRQLVWVTGLTRISDGATVTYGVWSGEDHETLTVESQSRLYYGGAGSLVLPPITYKVGTEIGRLSIGLTINDETENLVRGHQTFNRPVEVHIAMYNPTDKSFVDAKRYFKGFIGGTPLITPPVGGQSSLTIDCFSQARKGTKTVTGLKSRESQILRSATDTFYDYGALSDVAADPWGQKT
jgi:hypothetical protein